MLSQRRESNPLCSVVSAVQLCPRIRTGHQPWTVRVESDHVLPIRCGHCASFRMPPEGGRCAPLPVEAALLFDLTDRQPWIRTTPSALSERRAHTGDTCCL